MRPACWPARLGPSSERSSDERASGPRARIVAGVDGSPESVHALRWAVRQAELTGAGLQVTAWQYPTFFGWAPSDAVSPDGWWSACTAPRAARPSGSR
ncbi:MAG TPA: universal stress protein [Streptosporangiaceae bacterium]